MTWPVLALAIEKVVLEGSIVGGGTGVLDGLMVWAGVVDGEWEDGGERIGDRWMAGRVDL